MSFKNIALSIIAASAVLSQSVWAQKPIGVDVVGAKVVAPGAVVATDAALGAVITTPLIAIGTLVVVAGVTAGTTTTGTTGTK